MSRATDHHPAHSRADVGRQSPDSLHAAPDRPANLDWYRPGASHAPTARSTRTAGDNRIYAQAVGVRKYDEWDVGDCVMIVAPPLRSSGALQPAFGVGFDPGAQCYHRDAPRAAVAGRRQFAATQHLVDLRAAVAQQTRGFDHIDLQ